ncbi:MAG: DUF308 domain-containing protein [Bacteroidetes bacterium]|nr:DUF308 domain-containing protein [Bacteroidota bacterium]MBX7045553.1 DUF308 domain-containing protein [Ignavibacteria bacterium]
MKEALSSIRKIKINRGIIFISGIFFIILSIFVLKDATAVFFAGSILFGLLFLGGGIFEILFAIANMDKLWEWKFYIGFGVINVIISLVLFSSPIVAATLLPIFTGFWLLFRCIAIIGRVLEFKSFGKINRIALIALCSLGIIFALVILLNPPIGETLVTLWAALLLLMLGMFYLTVSIRASGAHVLQG